MSGKTHATDSDNFQPSDNLKDLKIGTLVEHQKFGVGKVTKLEGVFPNTKATVEFESVGAKQLLLKFAKVKIVV